jgi:hypothetical protein
MARQAAILLNVPEYPRGSSAPSRGESLPGQPPGRTPFDGAYGSHVHGRPLAARTHPAATATATAGAWASAEAGRHSRGPRSLSVAPGARFSRRCSALVSPCGEAACNRSTAPTFAAKRRDQSHAITHALFPRRSTSTSSCLAANAGWCPRPRAHRGAIPRRHASLTTRGSTATGARNVMRVCAVA